MKNKVQKSLMVEGIVRKSLRLTGKDEYFVINCLIAYLEGRKAGHELITSWRKKWKKKKFPMWRSYDARA